MKMWVDVKRVNSSSVPESGRASGYARLIDNSCRLGLPTCLELGSDP